MTKLSRVYSIRLPINVARYIEEQVQKEYALSIAAYIRSATEMRVMMETGKIKMERIPQDERAD